MVLPSSSAGFVETPHSRASDERQLCPNAGRCGPVTSPSAFAAPMWLESWLATDSVPIELAIANDKHPEKTKISSRPLIRAAAR